MADRSITIRAWWTTRNGTNTSGTFVGMTHDEICDTIQSNDWMPGTEITTQEMV